MGEPIREFVFHGERPHPWEITYAPTTQDRTQLAGKKAIQLRDEILKLNKDNVNTDIQDAHNEYIHHLGKHALKVQLKEDVVKEVERNKDGTLRLRPRMVKVEDMEDVGGKKAAELLLEQEWSTVSWTDEMVDISCETLFLRFQEDDFHLKEARRNKGVAMMDKLFNNHRPGDAFVRRIMDFCLSSTTSRVLRKGRCVAKWNLLYVINIAKVKCCKEVTGFGFCGKAFETLLLQHRLAAMLIQFNVRSQKEKRRIIKEHTELYNEIQQDKIDAVERIRTEKEKKSQELALLADASLEMKEEGVGSERSSIDDRDGSGAVVATTTTTRTAAITSKASIENDANERSSGGKDLDNSSTTMVDNEKKAVAFAIPSSIEYDDDDFHDDNNNPDHSTHPQKSTTESPALDAPIENDVNHGPPMSEELTKLLDISKSFGTDKEVCRMKLLVIDGRNADLRFRWDQMHNNQYFKMTTKFDIVHNGPVIIHPFHTKLILGIIAHLVSDQAHIDEATANREDVVKNHGVILLSMWLSNPTAQFARNSMTILSYVAKVWTSLFPILNCGAVAHCIRYMRFLRATYKELMAPVPTKPIPISTPLLPPETYGVSRGYQGEFLSSGLDSNSLIQEGSVVSNLPLEGSSMSLPQGGIIPGGGLGDNAGVGVETSLYSFSVDSGAEFSASLDVPSQADSKLVRMRAIQKAAELAETARQYYLDGVRMIMYLGEHAAGLHRARERVTPDGYIVERSYAITNVIANIAAADKAALAAANAARTGKKSSHGSSSSVSSLPPSEKQAKLDEHIGPVGVDYHMVLEEVSKVRSGPRGEWSPSEAVLMILGDGKVITEIVNSMVETVHIHIMRALLKCIFVLSCAECYAMVVKELCGFGGRALKRLIELLEEDDPWVSGLALGIFLQVCSLDTGRGALVGSANIPKLLADLLTCENGLYDHLPHQRAIYLSAALCRQQDWWAYAPEELLPLIMPKESAFGSKDNDITTTHGPGKKKPKHVDINARTDPTDLRRGILMDLVRTVKAPDSAFCLNATLADLNILPLNHQAALDLSRTCEAVTIRAMANFVCRPEFSDYFESLPWDESVAGCIILEALTLHPGTAENIFSPGALYFLGRCLQLTKVLFLQQPMSDRRTVMLLCGVTGAANALRRFCAYCAAHPSKAKAQQFAKIVRESDLMSATRYFIGTLAVSHPMLDQGTKELQQTMGMSVVKFFATYASMLLDVDNDTSNNNNNTKTLDHESTSKSIKNPSSLIPRLGGPIEVNHQQVNQNLLDLFPAGLAMCQLVKVLPSVHGRNDTMVDLLYELCGLLARLTAPRIGAYTAINEWKIIDSLRSLLPPPLTCVGPLGVHDPLYRTGLGALPATFFAICGNLCQMELFRPPAITEGFLRRALEKIVLQTPLLEPPYVLRQWTEGLSKGIPLPQGKAEREDIIACLKFVSSCANYQSPQCGASNDLIFQEEYHLMEILREMVGVDECPRSEPLFLAAIECLAVLSRDFMRLTGAHHNRFMELHMLEFALSQCELVELPITVLPDVVLVNALEIIQNMCKGLWTEELAAVIPAVREPLGKVSRVRPQFMVTIRDVNWEMTKGSQAFQKQYETRLRRLYSSNGMTMMEEEEEGVRYVNEGPFFVSTNNDNDIEEENVNDGKTGYTIGNGYTINGQFMGLPFNPKPGTYDACGISACGSLRNEGSAGHTHGSFFGTPDVAREIQLMRLSITTPSPVPGQGSLMAVSKIPVGGKEGGKDLEDRMRKRKEAMGFTERQVFTASAVDAAMKYLNDNNNNNNNSDPNDLLKPNNRGNHSQPHPGGHNHNHSQGHGHNHGLHKYASTGGILSTKPIPWSSKGGGKSHPSNGDGSGDASGTGSGYGSRPGTSSSGVDGDTTAYPYTDDEDFDTTYDGNGDGRSKSGYSNGYKQHQNNSANNGIMSRPNTGSSGTSTRPNTSGTSSGYNSGYTSATPMLHNNGTNVSYGPLTKGKGGSESERSRAGPGLDAYEGGDDEDGVTNQQQQQQQQGMTVKTMRWDPPSQSSYPQQHPSSRSGGSSRGSGSGGTTPSRRRRQPTQLMTIDADEIPGLNKTRPPPLLASQRPIVFPPVIGKYQQKSI